MKNIFTALFKKGLSFIGRIVFGLALVLVLLTALYPAQPVLAADGPLCYVNAGAGGANDGNSWTNAYTDLQSALTDTNCTEIWVAAGTYLPTSGTVRTATFRLVSGVGVYGGFAGTEISQEQRDPEANITILSGDIGVASNNSDNSYHVVTGSGTDNTAVLDGFTITAGNANGFSPTNYGGGGMYNYFGGPTLTNVTFSSNTARSGGGGMYNYYSSPTLTNVTFSGNTATYYGGGMGNYYSSPTLTNVAFSSNSADFGGGMYNSEGSPTLTNVTFSGNTATNYGDGGGMDNYYSSPALMNVTFSGNTADYGGGMYNYYSNPALMNVTFSSNTAIGGGGMYNYLSDPALMNVTFSGNTATGGGMYNYFSDPTLTNAILWGDAYSSGSEIYNDASTPTINNSVIQGGCPDGSTCTGVISDDPLLGALTVGGNPGQQVFPLAVGSSAIDAGDDANCPATDQRGVSRPQGSHCDIGAFEEGIYFVKTTGNGSSCSSWEDACTLQTALSITSSGDEIWVMQGVYTSTVGTDRTATFRLVSGVGVYGGFGGTETTRDQRDLEANITVLSGDIGVASDNSDNSYHVVTGSGTGNTAVLDGFTVTAGNANGSSPDYRGGGMYNNGGGPTLTNVTFSGNSAQNGGGMYNEGGSPTLTNVTFSGNTATSYGGGMYNYNSSPTLTNVVFSSNTANYGGGMRNSNSSSPALMNVTFSSNTATYSGGGMYNYYYSNPALMNVTFSGNTATGGGGMYNYLSDPTLTNAILWGDAASASSGPEIYNNVSTPTINTSVIQGGCPAGSTCTGVISDDPMLGTLGNYGGPTQTIPLLPGSSAIDAGNATYCTIGSDQRGVSYVGTCDIGAFESQGFSLTKAGGDNQATPINTAFTQPLAVAVTANVAIEPVDGGMITFSAPITGASALLNGSPATILSAAASITATANSLIGTYTVTASTQGANSINFALTNEKIPATVQLSNLTQTYDGTPKAVTVITVPEGLTVTVTYDGSATPPTDAGTYAVVATVDDPNYQGSASDTLTIQKATATVTLGNLTQAYDGTPKAVTVITVPEGLTVTVTYDGSATPPTDAGTYAVVATVDDPNYQGSASDTLTIQKATTTVTLSNLTQTYDGTPKAVSVITVPEGLTVTVTYDGSTTPPTNAGTYAVVATVDDPNYQGSASDTLTIQKAMATVTLSNLIQPYDGTPKAVAVMTVPEGLTVTVTYDGSTTPPIDIGTYAVVANVDDPNYEGSASDTLTITQGTATVTIGNLTQVYDGTPKAVTVMTVPEGLTVTVTYDGTTTPPTDAGTYTVVATVDEANYQGSASGTLTIQKATATVTISNLTQTYNGTPKSVTVITTPEGLAIEVTYDGSLTAPTEVGTYEVIVTVIAPNYEGTATGTLTISPSTTQFTLYLPMVIHP